MWKKLIPFLLFLFTVQGFNKTEHCYDENFWEYTFYKLEKTVSCELTPDIFRFLPTENHSRNQTFVFTPLKINSTVITSKEINFDSYREISTQKVFNILNIFQEFSIPFLLNSTSLSKGCEKGIDNLLNGLKKMEIWALKMIDASAKLPSGILSGNVNQYGDFDECIALDEAQYCLAEIEFKSWRKEFEPFKNMIHSYYQFRGDFKDPAHRVSSFSTIRWAFCIPKECTQKDLSKAVFEKTGAKVNLRPKMCQRFDKEYKLSFGDVFARLFFLTIIFAVIVSTILDFLNSLPERTTPQKFLMAFSMKRNWNKLFSLKQNNLKAVDGVRSLSALGLILSHKFIALLFNPYINKTQLSEAMNKPWTVMGRTAILYTDAFMLISGLLNAKACFDDLTKYNTIQFKNRLISRVLRIVPSILAVILFCTYILPQLGAGPMWPIVVEHHSDLCKNYMWRNLLFIHNYFGFENMCLTHTHQVGIDMQLFLLTPIIVYLIWKNKSIGFKVIITLFTFSTLLRFFVTYYNNISHVIYFGITVSKMFDTANLSYILPTHRASVYLLGVVLAYFLNTKKKITKNSVEGMTLWLLAIVLGLLSMFGPYHTTEINFKYDPLYAAWYAALSPIAVGLGISWLIYASNNDYGGWINEFLSWRGFQFFSKISYAVYLTQFPIFFYNVGKRKYSEEYTPFLLMQTSETSLIILISTLLTLCVEMPFQTLKNIILSKSKN